jgi:outer membrane lipoprotein-sorting protein
LAVGAALLQPTASAGAEELTLRQILDGVDDLHRGESSHGKMTLKVQTDRWTRELSLEFWSKGKARSLLRVLSPKKERGSATLRDENNIWNYLPRQNRVEKIPATLLADSWMGSALTPDDLVRKNRLTDAFTYAETFRGERDGQEVLEVTCTAKPNTGVAWRKVVVEVLLANSEGEGAREFLPLRIRYFDDGLALARTLTFSDVTRIGRRRVPATIRLTRNDKANEYTELTYQELELDVDVPDSMFSQQELSR